MAPPSALLEHLLDQLAAIGQPQGRRMFGGHGLYLDGFFIGIVADETLYLKADEWNQPAAVVIEKALRTTFPCRH